MVNSCANGGYILFVTPSRVLVKITVKRKYKIFNTFNSSMIHKATTFYVQREKAHAFLGRELHFWQR